MSNHELKIAIKGKGWIVRFLTNAMYHKKIGVDSGAITILDKKIIVFNKGNINPGFIRHELLHAFMEESSVESAMLTPIQIEEVCASIIQHHWHDINILTDQILYAVTYKEEIYE